MPTYIKDNKFAIRLFYLVLFTNYTGPTNLNRNIFTSWKRSYSGGIFYSFSNKKNSKKCGYKSIYKNCRP